MRSHHTPGPWRSGNAGLSVKTENGYWVADLCLEASRVIGKVEGYKHDIEGI